MLHEYTPAYDVIGGILGSGDRQHENQRHHRGEPGQGGDLRDHLENTHRKQSDSLTQNQQTRSE
ncbi:hypothetical protein EYF80_049748 [Liparis tanakae]|uniref:Uncharacterized protein n=1 Tax=Liparis tanakae TaxID=230148 RepID=A0A4Z2FFS2_9TELE|nr:hypothetical protein EYF80_049748 [Liparis tanakae]